MSPDAQLCILRPRQGKGKVEPIVEENVRPRAANHHPQMMKAAVPHAEPGGIERFEDGPGLAGGVGQHMYLAGLAIHYRARVDDDLIPLQPCGPAGLKGVGHAHTRKECVFEHEFAFKKKTACAHTRGQREGAIDLRREDAVVQGPSFAIEAFLRINPLALHRGDNRPFLQIVHARAVTRDQLAALGCAQRFRRRQGSVAGLGTAPHEIEQ